MTPHGSSPDHDGDAEPDDATPLGSSGWGRRASRPLVLAHRGARREAPDNTLAAFTAARRLGADGVELDVRRTRDGELVVHHDPDLPGGPVLADEELVVLRRLAPHVPTLVEALDTCAGLLVNVEVKNHPREPDFDPSARVVDDLVDLLASRPGADRVLVSSFHLPTIDRVRARAAHLPTAYVFKVGIGIDRVVDSVADAGHRALHPNLWAVRGRRGAALVARAVERALLVNVWTVNRPADAVRLATLGVDGLVTDAPDVVRDALAGCDQAGSTTERASGT